MDRKKRILHSDEVLISSNIGRIIDIFNNRYKFTYIDKRSLYCYFNKYDFLAYDNDENESIYYIPKVGDYVYYETVHKKGDPSASIILTILDSEVDKPPAWIRYEDTLPQYYI